MRAFWIASICLGTAAPAIADEYDLSGMMRPGLWESRTQEVRANGELGPAETDRDCVREEDIEDFSNFMREDDDQALTIEEFERGEDFVRYRMNFASDDPEVEVSGTLAGEMEFDGPERYTGSMTFAMNFQGQSMESTTKVDGRRIGDCTGEHDED